MVVGQLFLAVPRGCLQFVNVVFPDHTHLLFLLRNPIFFGYNFQGGGGGGGGGGPSRFAPRPVRPLSFRS